LKTSPRLYLYSSIVSNSAILHVVSRFWGLTHLSDIARFVLLLLVPFCVVNIQSTVLISRFLEISWHRKSKNGESLKELQKKKNVRIPQSISFSTQSIAIVLF
jgi:hypothetical protein